MSFAAEGPGMEPRFREDDGMWQVIQITTIVVKAAIGAVARDLQ